MMKKNKKVIVIIIGVLVVIGIMLVVSTSGSNKKQRKYQNYDNVEIIVKDNSDNLQGVGNNSQGEESIKGNINGAATVDEITGTHPNLEGGQPISTEEMLDGKEIGI